MMWVNFIAAIRQRVSIAGRTIDSSAFSRPNFKWTHYQNFGSTFFPKRYACCRPKVWNIFPGHKHEKIPKTSVSADLKARNVLSSLNARHARGTVTFPSRCRSWWKRRLTCVASSTISSHFIPNCSALFGPIATPGPNAVMSLFSFGFMLRPAFFPKR